MFRRLGTGKRNSVALDCFIVPTHAYLPVVGTGSFKKKV